MKVKLETKLGITCKKQVFHSTFMVAVINMIKAHFPVLYRGNCQRWYRISSNKRLSPNKCPSSVSDRLNVMNAPLFNNNNNNNNKNAFIKRITKQSLNALHSIKTRDKKAQHIYKRQLT